MILPQRPHIVWVLKYVGPSLLALLAWDVFVVFAFEVLHWTWLASRHVPLALYGSAIGIIVGFRNNSAYARWWEARTLWGGIVNHSRNLGRQVCATMGTPAKPGNPEVPAAAYRIVHYQIAFVHALRQQLRGLNPLPEVQNLVTPAEYNELGRQKNVALALQQMIGSALLDARRQGWIDSFEWQSIDRSVVELVAAQGGAERIRNTPLPKQYDLFPMLFVQIYCLLLPVGMVQNMGWFTPFGSTLVGFMFVALDKIGRNMEEPFANKIYDVPLTAITTTIEMNLRQMLGDTELPEPELPVQGVLW